MDLWRNPEHQFAAGRLLGRAAELLARCQVAVNRRMKVRFKLRYRLCVEGNDVIHVKYATDDDLYDLANRT